MKEITKDILFMTFGFFGSLTFFILLNIDFFTGYSIKGMADIQIISKGILSIMGMGAIVVLLLAVVTHKILGFKRKRKAAKELETEVVQEASA